MGIRDSGDPLVSIITVCYNSARSIERTFESVEAQDYPNIEYIVIDGGSTDGTVDLIKKHSGSIDYWVSEADGGIYDAMNKGIRASHGDYVAIMNSDDWYESGSVAKMVEGMREAPGAEVYTGIFRAYRDETPLYLKGNYFENLENDMPPHSTCFVSRGVYDKIGLYDLRYRSASDYDFLLKCKKAGVSFRCLPVLVSNFRLGGMSSSLPGLTEAVRIDRKYGYSSAAGALARLSFYYVRDFIRRLVKSHARYDLPTGLV